MSDQLKSEAIEFLQSLIAGREKLLLTPDSSVKTAFRCGPDKNKVREQIAKLQYAIDDLKAE